MKRIINRIVSSTYFQEALYRIEKFIEEIRDRFDLDKESKSRSAGSWRTVRNRYIEKNPYCEICGYYNLSNDVHHIIPRSVDPGLLLDKDNLMTLCRRYHCHLRFGHFGNYRAYHNPNIKSLKEIGQRMIKLENAFKNNK